MSSRNSTRHYEVINADTNETIMVAKGRNSFGGFVNMMRRIASDLGATPGPSGLDLNPGVDGGTDEDPIFVANGTRFRLAETNVL